MMMRPGDILGRIFLYCHRNQSSDHRDLSTEHTEGTEFFGELLRKMFWSSEDRVRACFHYAESRQNKPQVNL